MRCIPYHSFNLFIKDLIMSNQLSLITVLRSHLKIDYRGDYSSLNPLNEYEVELIKSVHDSNQVLGKNDLTPADIKLLKILSGDITVEEDITIFDLWIDGWGITHQVRVESSLVELVDDESVPVLLSKHLWDNNIPVGCLIEHPYDGLQYLLLSGEEVTFILKNDFQNVNNSRVFNPDGNYKCEVRVWLKDILFPEGDKSVRLPEITWQDIETYRDEYTSEQGSPSYTYKPERYDIILSTILKYTKYKDDEFLDIRNYINHLVTGGAGYRTAKEPFVDLKDSGKVTKVIDRLLDNNDVQLRRYCAKGLDIVLDVYNYRVKPDSNIPIKDLLSTLVKYYTQKGDFIIKPMVEVLLAKGYIESINI